MTVTENNNIHKAFRFGIFAKLFDGTWQVFGGLFLLIEPNAALHGIIAELTEHDLTRTSHSFLANYLNRLDGRLSHGLQLFVAAYLLAHGLTKVILAVNLWRDKLWAYPLMIITLAIFILYQTYQLGYSWSWSLLGLTLFDAAFLALTLFEYRARLRLERA